ncbi:hypothetical protein ACCY16_20245 [Candidatus Pantoea formicae]
MTGSKNARHSALRNASIVWEKLAVDITGIDMLVWKVWLQDK